MPDDVLNALVWGCSPSDFALAVQSGQIIVADIWGELAGFVWLDATHGKELVVSPKHYRTGIARILLIEGVRILLERTTAEITIYVTQNSINWYKRLGFNFIESITVQHLQSGTRIPLEKMVLDRDDALLLTERGRA